MKSGPDMESLRDPGFPRARERGNFQIQKQVTNRGDEREDESDEWKRNSSSGDSNLNSGILATEYKCL